VNPAASDLLPWSRVRWWGTIFLVAVAQVELIVLLSQREPVVPRQPDQATAFHLVADAPPGSAMAELLEIDDPTLFSLPDPRGFSGPAWMRAPTLQHQSRDWTEPQRWLTLRMADLGAAFMELVRTNVVAPRPLADKPPPRLSEVALAPVPLRANSTFRIEGDLTGRELLRPLEVPSMPNTEILTNTVVQIGVNAAGFTFSAVPLSSSGSKTADQRAVELAKAARFKPLARSGPMASADRWALTWGKIIFQWHTVEVPATGDPLAKPQP